MTQSIDLDFIQAPLFSLSRFAVLRLSILTIGIAAVVIAWQLQQTKQAQLALLEAKIAQLQQVQKVKPNVEQTKVAISAEIIRELQDTVNVLAMPWDGLFEVIENTANKDVTLLSLEPNPKKQLLILTGEAKNLQITLQYLAQLQKQSQAQSVLSQIFLQKHSVDESNVSKPVRFSVQAKWETTR